MVAQPDPQIHNAFPEVKPVKKHIILQLAENGLPIFMDSLKDNLATIDEASE